MTRSVLLAVLMGCAMVGAAHADRFFDDASLIAGTGCSGRAEGLAGDSRLDRPEGVALSADGSILYIADSGNHRLCKVDLASTRLSELPVAGLRWPRRLFLQGSTGRLVVEDRDAKTVMAVDLSSNATTTLLSLTATGAGILAWGAGPAPEELLLVEYAGAGVYLLRPQQALRRVGSLALEQLNALKHASLYVANGAIYAVNDGATHATPLTLLEPQEPFTAPPAGTAAPAPVPLSLAASALSAALLPYNGVRGLVSWSPSEDAFVYQDLRDNSRMVSAPWNMDGLSRTELAKAPRCFFQDAPALAFDPQRAIFYATDSPSHRVVAVRVPAWVNTTPEGYGLQGPKTMIPPPGIQRVVAYGDSFTFYSDNLYARTDLLVSTRMQYYWNLFDMLKGKPGNREVIVSSMTLHLGADPISRGYYHSKVMDLYKPKEVVLFIHQDSVLCLVNNFVYRSMPDDLVGPEDGEWALKTEAEKAPFLGPNARTIMAILKERKDLRLIGTAEPEGNAMRLFEDPRYLKAGMAIYAKNLARLKGACDQKGIRLIVVMLPVRNQIGQGECVQGARNNDSIGIGEDLEPALAKASQQVGVPFIPIYKEMQQLEPGLFPMIMAQDDHFVQRAHERMAQLVGYRLSQLEDQWSGATADVPKPGPVLPLKAGHRAKKPRSTTPKGVAP